LKRTTKPAAIQDWLTKTIVKRAKSRSQKKVKESIIYHAENTEKEPFKGLEAVLKYRKRLSI